MIITAKFYGGIMGAQFLDYPPDCLRWYCLFLAARQVRGLLFPLGQERQDRPEHPTPKVLGLNRGLVTRLLYIASYIIYYLMFGG